MKHPTWGIFDFFFNFGALIYSFSMVQVKGMFPFGYVGCSNCVTCPSKSLLLLLYFFLFHSALKNKNKTRFMGQI